MHWGLLGGLELTEGWNEDRLHLGGIELLGGLRASGSTGGLLGHCHGDWLHWRGTGKTGAYWGLG